MDIPVQLNFTSFPPTQPPPHLKEKQQSAPYIQTTETGQEEALASLKQIPIPSNGCLLGFSLEFNHNILATREIKQALICDIDPKMHDLYQWISNTIVKDISRKEFISKFKKEIEKEDYNTPSKFVDEIIGHYEKDSFMWTAQDASFKKIQKMHREGRITYANVNIWKDRDYFESLSAWLKKNDAIFDVIYTSNIPEWAYESRKVTEMQSNLLKVMSPKTLYIDAKKEQQRGSPKIRITGPGILKDENFPSMIPERTHAKYKRLTNQGGFAKKALKFG